MISPLPCKNTTSTPTNAGPYLVPPRLRLVASLAWVLFAGLLLPLCGAPKEPGKRLPNILFAIADDWGPHAGAYGTPWVKTPAFDRVAREGLLFKNAYTPMAKCAPSRAILL